MGERDEGRYPKTGDEITRVSDGKLFYIGTTIFAGEMPLYTIHASDGSEADHAQGSDFFGQDGAEPKFRMSEEPPSEWRGAGGFG